jgi:hypothetical protein
MAKLTTREEFIAHSHRALRDMARKAFPRSYASDLLHGEESTEICRETADTFLAAMARKHGQYLEGSELAATLNARSPDDCRLVSSREFDEMRDHAIAGWKFIYAVEKAIQTADPAGAVADLLRDSKKFDREFHLADLEMQDVIDNNAG